MPTDERLSGVVSEAERASFVKAVLTGKLSPDLTQIAYHFAGKLDEDVVDVILEASSDPSKAVSTLAGMSSAAGGDAVAATAKQPGKAISTSKDAQAQDGGAQVTSRRQAMTLEAIQAHRGSTVSPPPFCEDHARAGCVGKEAGGGGGGSTDAELERVAQFISSYAGEQEAAAKAAGTAAKPPASPFIIPRGTVVPPNSKLQLVVINTAAKTVEIPGFEVFMKIQHGKDALFRFLGTDHALHSYYLLAKRHAQDTVMKGGNARGSSSPPPNKPQPPKTEDPDRSSCRFCGP